MRWLSSSSPPGQKGKIERRRASERARKERGGVVSGRRGKSRDDEKVKSLSELRGSEI
jgi:hypothetical protein